MANVVRQKLDWIRIAAVVFGVVVIIPSLCAFLINLVAIARAVL